jgi:hypothetical protein
MRTTASARDEGMRGAVNGGTALQMLTNMIAPCTTGTQQLSVSAAVRVRLLPLLTSLGTAAHYFGTWQRLALLPLLPRHCLTPQSQAQMHMTSTRPLTSAPSTTGLRRSLCP